MTGPPRGPRQALCWIGHTGANFPLRAIEMTLPEGAINPTNKSKSSLCIYERMMTSENAIEGPTAFAEKR